MENATEDVAAGNSQATRARQLLQEIERVMQEIQADLDAAEAKFGRNREPIIHRSELSVATA